MKPPFASHLKKHVLQIGRDAYIHPNDPFYIEKVLRFKQESPEFHFRMGQEHESQGRYSRALFHYIEAIRADSCNHSKAKDSLVKLEKKIIEKNHRITDHDTSYKTLLGSPLSMILIIILFLSNLIFISLLLVQSYFP